MDLECHVDTVSVSALYLNGSRLLEGVQELLDHIRSMLGSEPKLVSVTIPSFGCLRGYQLDGDGEGCSKSSLKRFVIHTIASVISTHLSVSNRVSSRLSCWDILQRGGVSSLSSGNLPG